MNTQKELRAMAERAFDDGLLETVLSAYRQEMDAFGYEVDEREYHEGKTALAAALNADQRAKLTEMEDLCTQNAKYALGAGFSRGVYAAFQQFFSGDAAPDPFQELVEKQVLTLPGMAREVPFYHRKTRINEINEQLDAQLGKSAQEALLCVYSGWEERVYGILRHTFYLGYRCGFSILGRVEPDGAYGQMLGHILLTEHELGFTFTKEERENRRVDPHKEA